MRKGTFEEREGAGGEKFYRLTWEQNQYSLSSKEIMSGLFIRYLISRGKLSEYVVPPQTGLSQDNVRSAAQRKRAVE